MLPGIHRQADRREGRQDRGRDDENEVVASHGIRSVFGSRGHSKPAAYLVLLPLDLPGAITRLAARPIDPSTK
jgi:hypothetical protein